MEAFQYFYGIDQTGALASKGRDARPLATALYHKQGNAWSLSLARIPSFSKFELEGAFSRSLCKSTLILVDAVLWPMFGKGAKGLRRGFLEAASFTHNSKHYGREVAERFFRSALATQFPSAVRSKVRVYPRRECEKRAQANSVFQTRPYQRNIQCGTFRIWKNLGAYPEWCMYWPFQTQSNLPTLAEGYPSEIWRKVFGLKTRDREQLSKMLARVRMSAQDRDLISRDADFADAAVLAMGSARMMARSSMVLTPSVTRSMLNREGWIFGVA